MRDNAGIITGLGLSVNGYMQPLWSKSRQKIKTWIFVLTVREVIVPEKIFSGSGTAGVRLEQALWCIASNTALVK